MVLWSGWSHVSLLPKCLSGISSARPHFLCFKSPAVPDRSTVKFRRSGAFKKFVLLIICLSLFKVCHLLLKKRFLTSGHILFALWSILACNPPTRAIWCLFPCHSTFALRIAKVLLWDDFCWSLSLTFSFCWSSTSARWCNLQALLSWQTSTLKGYIFKSLYWVMLIHSTSHSTVAFALLLKQHHTGGVRGCILWIILIFFWV